MQSGRKLHPQLQNLFTDVKPEQQRPRPNYDTGSMIMAAFCFVSLSVVIGVVLSTIIMKLIFGV
jgi:hypothetical protein